MQAVINIETEKLVREIAQEVAKRVKPIVVSNNPEDVLFGVEELSKHLTVSDQWIYERVQLKEIPHIKMGKFLRFRKLEIDSWLDSKKVPAMNPLTKPINAIKKHG
jgi:excisionase family DNA binding protein